MCSLDTACVVEVLEHVNGLVVRLQLLWQIRSFIECSPLLTGVLDTLGFLSFRNVIPNGLCLAAISHNGVILAKSQLHLVLIS